MQSNIEDTMLAVAIAKKRAIVILTLIDQEETYNEVLNSVLANLKVEQVVRNNRLNSERGMKEYRDCEGKAKFIMTDSQKFCLEFGNYRYEGYFPMGTKEKLKEKVTEIIFYVSNTVKVGMKPTRIAVKNFSVLGIENIFVK